MKIKSRQDESTGDRYLIVHSDPDVRQRLARSITAASGNDVTIHEADFPTTAANATRQFRPKAILIELDDKGRLSHDVVESLRNEAVHIIGLYNPASIAESESAFLRAATRAGASDFITIPAAESEIQQAIESVKAYSPDGQPGRKTGHITCFLSHKGGAGTSTLALNTAAALAAQDGANAALFDADFQFGDAAELAGMENRSRVMDLLDQLKAGMPIDPYLQQEPGSGLFILGAPESILEAELIGPEELSRILLALSRRFDDVIVDLPRSIDLNTIAALDLADSIFVVSEPIPKSVDRARQLVDLLLSQGYSADRIQVVLNQSISSSGYISQDEYQKAFGFEIHSLIIHDPKNLEFVSRNGTLPLFRGKSSIRRGVVELATTIAST